MAGCQAGETGSPNHQHAPPQLATFLAYVVYNSFWLTREPCTAQGLFEQTGTFDQGYDWGGARNTTLHPAPTLTTFLTQPQVLGLLL